MEKQLNLIDHTIDGILKERQDIGIKADIYDILGKYAVSGIDLSAASVKHMVRPTGSRYLRMELDLLKLPLERLIMYCSFSLDGIILRWKHGCDPEVLQEALSFLRAQEKALYLKIINAAVLTEKELIWYALLVKEYGISGFLYCDTESSLDPFSVSKHLEPAKEILPCKIEFMAGNGCGLATANSLAAIQCGIYTIHTIVGGANLSEGAAMEEIILSCKYFGLAQTCEHTRNLARDCRKILHCMQLKIPVDKAIIGEGIFSHESGIHVDGVMKNPSLYEVISPEEVGVKRKIVIGKHSGKAAIRLKYEQLGLRLSEEEIACLFGKIKQLSLEQNAPLTEKQLIGLYHTENAARK